MISGARVHRRLLVRIRSAEDALGALEGEVRQLHDELAELAERREARFRELAEFHLPELTAASVGAALADVRTEVEAILAEKVDRREELAELVPAAHDEVLEIEARVEGLVTELNRLGEERERLERSVLEELEADPEWVSLAERTRTARARAELAERRHEAALRERAEKTPPYERDLFFSYLSGRGVGTPKAVGNALTRRLDGWVADVVGYAGAREDYEVLQALPQHAAQRLSREREALEAVAGPLRARHAAAADRHGLSPVLREGDAVYTKREQALAALAEAEDRHRARAAELASMDDTRGRYFQKAIERLRAFLEGRTPTELLESARATGDSRDDRLVEELARIDDRLKAITTELARAREDRSRALDQVDELRRLRRHFEARDWNGRRSEFRRGIDVDSLLLGYLQGRHSVGHVRGSLERAQRFRPPAPGPGSGSGGGFFSGGGFSGGGGFSSGGGFSGRGGSGGGGFSTGGGF